MVFPCKAYTDYKSVNLITVYDRKDVVRRKENVRVLKTRVYTYTTRASVLVPSAAKVIYRPNEIRSTQSKRKRTVSSVVSYVSVRFTCRTLKTIGLILQASKSEKRDDAIHTVFIRPLEFDSGTSAEK